MCRWALSPTRTVPNDGFSLDGVAPLEAGSSSNEAQAAGEPQGVCHLISDA